ncbi:MAG: hypothetical protein EBY20_09040 [Alphaproteobacteria bacterium]|nr:hypothetical protein [Alphaproteobacteria bacterium]
MDATQILTDRIQHEIDMDILRQIGEKVGADLTKEIELAEKKFNNKLDRAVNGMTNKSVHGTSETMEGIS